VRGGEFGLVREKEYKIGGFETGWDTTEVLELDSSLRGTRNEGKGERGYKIGIVWNGTRHHRGLGAGLEASGGPPPELSRCIG